MRKKYVILIMLIILVILICLCIKSKVNKDESITEQDKIENKIKNNEWKTISKYNTVTKQNENVLIKINRITNGKDAENIVENYYGKTSYKYSENEKWNILEYQIDLKDFTTIDELGNTASIQVKVLSEDNQDSFRLNNRIYIPNIIDLNLSKYSNDKIIEGKMAFSIDKNIEKYKIKIGSDKFIIVDGK